MAASPKATRKVNTQPPADLKKSGNINDYEKKALMKHGHHVEYTPHDDVEGTGRQFNKTVKTTIHIPEERMVKIPVVRKEKEKIIEKHVVQATKLVPVTKYKEVREIDLHDRLVQPGEKSRSRSALPTTQVLKTYNKAGRIRKIPYTDFEEQTYDIVVDVPKEVVKTRVGYRMDKQLHSHVVEVEEDCVFEMRPVLISKGASRAKEVSVKKREGKAVHGDPVWDGGLHDGWRPDFGAFSDAGSRPGSPGSRPGTSYSTMSRLTPKRMERTGRPGTQSAPDLRRH